MKKIILNDKIIRLYDSIDEMPIVNFQKYNKYLLIDSGIGSDADDIDAHITKVAKFINSGDKKSALMELQNMRQNMHMVNNELSPKYLAFAALIYSINDKVQTDLSDENLKDILLSIKEIKHIAVIEFLNWLKKKVSTELELYFPGDFTSVKEKDLYDKLKQRTLLMLDSIENDTDNSESIAELDLILFKASAPKAYVGKESVEIQYDKQFESACFIISQKSGLNAKKLTVLQFYNALDNIKRQLEAESKSFKRNNIR